jgi:DNA invertase Pin-like site-specific DNA recombinase
LDRLSRDQEDVAALYKHLTFSDVQLVTLSDYQRGASANFMLG